MGYLIESIRLRVLNDNAQSCGNAAYAGKISWPAERSLHDSSAVVEMLAREPAQINQ
jgi:hypothetical protein